jgi:hypothetical protein
MPSAPPPVACDLTVFSDTERESHMSRAERSLSPAETEELPDGFLLRYGDRPELVRELGAFVEGERRCCPFFTFELRVEGGSPFVTLTIKGPPEGKAVLAAGLELIKQGYSGEEARRLFAARTGARI